ncbi:HAMP domain-containing sensor histidine kinase [Vibrio sp. RE88]|uniref:sensor histidine kinase n=1 Tax=Vibrio sp. RE88 TaxID=2607610 RepID=UPI0014938589|nr:HAMP domain-containing sensor histidine kinase [Vibrio sp. RE88]NOH62793.1 HAMP domain-containing histidine kinase [Vibrio sp. RE88]
MYDILFGERINDERKIEIFALWHWSLIAISLLSLFYFCFNLTVTPSKTISNLIKSFQTMCFVIVSYSSMMTFFSNQDFRFGESFSEAIVSTLMLWALFIGLSIIYYSKSKSGILKARFTRLGISVGSLPMIFYFLDSIFTFNFPIWQLLYFLIVSLLCISAFQAYARMKQQVYDNQVRISYETDKYKTIGRLAMGVAHEINNPLTATALSIEALHHEECPKERTLLLERAELGVDRASKICQSLLNYSNNRTEKKLECKVYLLVENALNILANKVKNNALKINIPSELTFFVMPTKMEEVLINIVNNAIDASGPRSEIIIDAVGYQDKVKVSVTDFGSGFIESDLNKIFEPFYSTKPIGKGTGLGLSICKRILDEHNGEIIINSDPNFGTKVTIVIPSFEK